MNWTIEARGDVRELYSVEAEDEDEVRKKWECGAVDGPWLSEVEGVGIVCITRDDA